MPTPSSNAKSRAERPHRGRERRKRSSEPKAHANAAKTPDPLLAAICHDLRAPLAAVTMGATFVLQATRDDDASSRQRRILEAMLRSCAQMERLIRNFADLSEIEADAVVLRLGLHDAFELVELAARSVQDKASDREIVLALEAPPEPILLRCDRERLLRALGHLLDNAVNAAPSRSTVRVAVSSTAGSVAFTVVDHGPGVSDEVAEFLSNAHATHRVGRIGKGSGLGVARGFARAHDGALTVSATANEPMAFTLTVPIGGPTNGATESATASATEDATHA